MATQIMPRPTPPVQLNDEILNLEEAARFIRMSEDWLRKSDVPRAKMGTPLLFLKSQLLLYVTVHHTHFVELPPS